MTDFEMAVAKTAEAQNHSEEIKKTRIGGLGGSDAKILYKIGTQGLSALTQTDSKRIAIMLGMIEQNDWSGNAAMNAGHLFEDYAFENVVKPQAREYMRSNNECAYLEREQYIEEKLAVNFRTFAHADFALGADNKMNSVIECKYSQKPTEQVLSTYAEQLQWYYMLGKQRVALLHGTGSVEPFEVQNVEMVDVPRDEDMIKALLNGINILDKAISKCWTPILTDKCSIEEVPNFIRDAFEKLAAAKKAAAEAKVAEDEAKAVLSEFMQDMCYSEINGYSDTEGNEHKVTITKPRTVSTFDKKAFTSLVEKHFEGRADVIDDMRQLMKDAMKTTTGAPAFSYK